MPRFGLLLAAASLAAFAACSSAPKEPAKDIAQEPPPAQVQDTTPSPSPQDIKWEEECLLYPKADALRSLQGSGIRRHCTGSEAPENVKAVLTEGLAADEVTATAVARAVLARLYGEKIVGSAEPTITPKGDRWLVQWEVKAPEQKEDALKRLSVEIVKRTGAVSRMFVSVVKE